MKEIVTTNVIEEASLFLTIATPQDIEFERQAMEARHNCKLAVHNVETVTRSGARCTRVTWRYE